MTASDKWLSALSGDVSLHRAAKVALTARLDGVAGALDGLGDASDAEAVHALRVATRRAEAALRLFAELLPPRRAEWLRKRLRRVRRAAGAVRDLDVIIERHRALAGDTLDPTGREVLDDTAALRRRAARRLTALVRRLRAKNFSARTASLVARVRPRGEAARARRLGPAARERLGPLVARLLDRAVTSDDDDPTLHALRIDAKRLRYAMELVGGAFDATFRAAMYEEVARLQGRLGVIHDHASAAASFRRRRARTRDPARRSRLRALAELEARACGSARRAFFAWWTTARVERLAERFASRLSDAPRRRAPR